MKRRKWFPAVACLLGSSALASLHAGTFTANFDNGQLPANTQVFGNAVVEATGGVNDSGTLKVTKAVNSQQGSFIIEDFDAGANVYGFKASFMARVGGGTSTPADGWSFSVAPDLPDAGWGEQGVGTGITVMFDTYDNVDADPNNGIGEAPQISFKVGGQVVKTTGLLKLSDLITGSQFVPVSITLNADGSFDLDFNGKTLFSKYFFPNYQPLAGVRYGFGGRTGGANENCFIDDLKIETYLKPVPGMVQQPASQTIVEGKAAVFTMALNNAEGATIQWYRDGTTISGATGTTYTLDSVKASDAGAKFMAKVTLGTTTVTSAEAVLSVASITLPATPALSFDFNDGAVPVGTAIFGTAIVNPSGGVDDSGFMMLTDALNDQNGSFIVEDPAAGKPVYGIAARFDVRMGGGTANPADGFSFNFATDLPDTVGESENGAGTGLSVTADIYDNGGGEAPSFSVKYGGAVVADKVVPRGAMLTGDGFAEVIVRLTADGLLDLAWNGAVIFDRIQVPGFSSLTGGRVGFYARTGGENEVHAIDNLRIYTYLTADVVRFTTKPTAQTVLAGKTASFLAEVNLTDNATYQWFKNGTAIGGATQNSYTTPAVTATDQGAKFKVQVKRGDQTITSDEVVLTVLDLAAPVNPQLSYNFNGALPAGAEVTGTALLDTTGGVDNSGVLKITMAENSQVGGFRSELIAGGAQMDSFTLAVDVLAGGGSATPADGFSINIASDLTVGPPGDAENGGGTGFTLAFDTYDNGGGEAPSIDIRYKGNVVVSKKVPLSLLNVADTYFPVLIRVNKNGTLDLAYGDVIVYNGEPIPEYAPLSGAKVAIYARTGGLNANYWFDNLRLEAQVPQAVSITIEPADTLGLTGNPVTYNVQVSNPNGITYQWMRDGVAIPGATQATYTTPALTSADANAGFSVKVTGANNTLTSRVARVMLLDAFTAGANPPINLNFDDGQTPAGSAVYGNAVVEEGVLKLTIAENSQNSSFLLDTPAGVSPIYDFTATWRMRVGGGSAVPADGFSFVLADDVPEAGFGEDGAGSGLSVSFDIYNNGSAEAPAIDISYKGEVVATRKYAIEALRTGDNYVTIGVRVNRDGTLDLYYGDMAVYRNLALPKFTPFNAGKFAWGARTGGLNENQWVDDVKIAVNTQPAVVEKPQFSGIKKNTDGTLTVTWTGGGTLQVAPAVTGPYQDVAGAASPYTFTPTSPSLFGRIRK